MEARTLLLVLAVITAVLYALYVAFLKPKVDTDATPIDPKGYDYVVVGGGSAGAVVAARLSEDADVTVLLLEAGGSEVSKREVAIPAASALLQNSVVDWQYRTAPQKHSSKALHNGVSWWPRGKVLGGSSAINYMQYVRGHAEDYDSWGVKGWDWKSVLPFFRKSEHCTVPTVKADAASHGTGGPMCVSLPVHPHPLSNVFVDACDQSGISRAADYNNATGDNHGAALSQTTTRNGRREDTASAFLRPILHTRKNLTVRTRAHVLRVLFDDSKTGDSKNGDSKTDGPRATGVVYRTGKDVKHAADQIVRAHREVVLCGGAVASPHLLLVSGVGPRAQLAKHNIPVVCDLPGVGQNLQDHLFFALPHESRTATYTDADGNVPNLFRYLLKGEGPFTSTGLECTAFFNTGVRPDLKAPDMQIHFLAAKLGDKEANNTNIDRQRVKNPPCAYSMTFLCVGLHPRSVGSLTLASADPLTHPVIDPNYLAHQDDVNAFIAAVRKVQEITKSKAMQPHVVRCLAIDGQKLSEAERAECGAPDSDKEWEYRIRSTALTCYHPVGTCRLANDLKSDPMGVVDAQCRVFGVRGLRVADASVLCNVPSGNTNAPAIMVGEKAADMIRNARQK